MPELPEVETIAQGLRQGGADHPGLPGMHVQAASLYWPRTLATPAPAEFQSRLVGQVIQSIGRRGKYLILQFQPDYLLIHLRMSGDLRVRPAGQPPEKHDRLALTLAEGWQLAFNDTRKFGRAWLVADPLAVTGQLGPEPLEEAGLTLDDWRLRLNASRRQLKPLLLDQSFLAGLGNIYTDEALHLSGLHPLTPANQIGYAQSERLLESIRQVLQAGIRSHGASIDWVYRGGQFQNQFRVYGRTGQPCQSCGAAIQRILVGQRSTHFCPHCQPAP